MVLFASYLGKKMCFLKINLGVYFYHEHGCKKYTLVKEVDNSCL